MTLGLRLLLILGAIIYFVFVVRKLRASAVEPGDMLFWVLFALVLLLISLFPGVVEALCRFVGIQSPANMVFLCIIALLSYKCFSMAVKLSALSMKLKTLVSAQSAQSAAEREDGKNAESKGDNP